MYAMNTCMRNMICRGVIKFVVLINLELDYSAVIQKLDGNKKYSGEFPITSCRGF